jgi:GT2 family glycosyltransferase
VGDALYRYATEPAYVDTVPFGAFRRETFDRLGMFDETLLTNEDYEMNARIRQSGGRVYLDPRIHSVYFSRASLGELARQYARYGYWKWRMLRSYPGTLRWRQLLPPVFVLSLIGLLILSIFWGAARWLLLVELVLYFLALAAGSFKAARRQRDPRLLAAVPLAIATMHLTWGSALLWSALTTRGSAASKA